jgi:hypothetical protein
MKAISGCVCEYGVTVKPEFVAGVMSVSMNKERKDRSFFCCSICAIMRA